MSASSGLGGFGGQSARFARRRKVKKKGKMNVVMRKILFSHLFFILLALHVFALRFSLSLVLKSFNSLFAIHLRLASPCSHPSGDDPGGVPAALGFERVRSGAASECCRHQLRPLRGRKAHR